MEGLRRNPACTIRDACVAIRDGRSFRVTVSADPGLRRDISIHMTQTLRSDLPCYASSHRVPGPEHTSVLPQHPCVWMQICTVLMVLFMGSVLPTAPSAFSQSISDERESTEARLDALKEQIERDEQRLRETTQAEQASLQRLDQIQREIALREELVSTYERRMGQLRAEREGLRDTLDVLERRLSRLRGEYQQYAEHAYKYGRLRDVALIMASESVSQMLVRVRYLRRFAEQRREQQASIRAAARQISRRTQDLQASEEKTENLLAEARTERENLSKLQTDRQSLVAQLRDRRSELRQEIDRKEASAQALERQIRDLVARAEARNRRTRSASASSAARAAEYARLSATFEQNRGSLPWPAEGAVTEGFGNRIDPVHGTETYHPGILIATNPRATVRAVFDGVVTGVDFVPGYGTYLVIQHGDYLSVYSNFSSLFVSQGDEIEAGDILGRTGTREEPRGAGLFFAVFDKEQNTSVDPSGWLSRR